MHTTRELLSLVKQRHHVGNDSALARLLGLTRQGISHHMKGRVHLGQDNAIRVAELLDLPPEYVIACAEAERAQTDRTRAFWRKTAERAAGLTACFLAVVCASILIPGLTVENGLQISLLAALPAQPLCIMLNAISLAAAVTLLILWEPNKNN